MEIVNPALAEYYEDYNFTNDDEPKKVYNDSRYSIFPSYTNINIHYELVTRSRYHRNLRKYERQLHRELEKLEKTQQKAYDAFRFTRTFAITSLWPPLHTKKDIEKTCRTFFSLTPKQEARVRYLMSEKLC